jgi:hypothetical protein
MRCATKWIFFGGAAGNETWAWQGGWVQRTPTIPPAAVALPWLGQPLELRASPVPTGQAAVLFGSAAPSSPLPLDGIGMFGCELFVGLDGSVATVAVGTVASWSLPIPGSAALLGSDNFFQAEVVAPGANPASLIGTNALRARIGAL